MASLLCEGKKRCDQQDRLAQSSRQAVTKTALTEWLISSGLATSIFSKCQSELVRYLHLKKKNPTDGNICAIIVLSVLFTNPITFEWQSNYSSIEHRLEKSCIYLTPSGKWALFDRYSIAWKQIPLHNPSLTIFSHWCNSLVCMSPYIDPEFCLPAMCATSMND